MSIKFNYDCDRNIVCYRNGNTLWTAPEVGVLILWQPASSVNCVLLDIGPSTIMRDKHNTLVQGYKKSSILNDRADEFILLIDNFTPEMLEHFITSPRSLEEFYRQTKAPGVKYEDEKECVAYLNHKNEYLIIVRINTHVGFKCDLHTTDNILEASLYYRAPTAEENRLIHLHAARKVYITERTILSINNIEFMDK